MFESGDWYKYIYTDYKNTIESREMYVFFFLTKREMFVFFFTKRYDYEVSYQKRLRSKYMLFPCPKLCGKKRGKWGFIDPKRFSEKCGYLPPLYFPITCFRKMTFCKGLL